MITVEEGERAQALQLNQHQDKGDAIIGWKIGFGSNAAKGRLGIENPLVGFLVESGTRTSPVDLRGCQQPKYETEVAVWLGADLGPHPDAQDVRAAVAGVGQAFEFVDLTMSEFHPEVVGEILHGNIFHVGYTLSTPITGMTIDDIASLTAEVRCLHSDGTEEVFAVTDPVGMIGPAIDTVIHAASQALTIGRGLKAGDVLLMGSLVPPQPVRGGDRVTYTWPGGHTITTEFV